MAKIVVEYSTAYRMSDRKYRQYLIAGVNGKEPLAAEYGSVVGAVAFNSTDASKSDFEVYLTIEQAGNTPTIGSTRK